MNLIMVPLRLAWNLIKAVKTSILVILVIVSVTLNVAQFTGSALAGMVETAIKSTLGITSVTTKATIRAAKASASVTKLTNQVANLNATTTTSTKMIANLRSKLAKSAATAQVAQRTALTKQKAKLKAQARLKRSLVAVPILGVGLALLFEERIIENGLRKIQIAGALITHAKWRHIRLRFLTKLLLILWNIQRIGRKC